MTTGPITFTEAAEIAERLVRQFPFAVERGSRRLHARAAAAASEFIELAWEYGVAAEKATRAVDGVVTQPVPSAAPAPRPGVSSTGGAR